MKKLIARIKNNEKLKKILGYIGTFFAGVATVVFFNYRRNNTAQSNIDQLRNKLAENEKLLDGLNNDNEQLRLQLASSRNNVNELAEQLKLAAGNVDKIKSINSGLESESTNIDRAIEQLRKFISENGKTEQGDQDCE